MPHRFDPSKAHILDSEERRRIFPPEKIVEILMDLDIQRNVAVDVGAGTGYLTIPLSGMFKRVYAIEISEEIAEILRKNLEKEGIKNVGIIITEKPPEFDFEVNLILFSNVLHEMENPQKYLCWSKRGDYVLIAEWKKIKTEMGPPLEDRISIDEILKMCDFEVILLNESLPYHYIAVLKPS